MKPFQRRALATILALGVVTTVAHAAEAGKRLLPTTSEDVPGPSSQNLSTRWADVTETSQVGLGSGFKARFTSQEAYVTSNLSSTVDARSYDGMYFVLSNTGQTPSYSSVELLSRYTADANGKFVIALGLNPGETKRVVVWFQDETAPKQMGVYPAQLDVPAQTLGGGSWNFDPSRVTGWLMWNSGGPATLELKDLRLVKKRRDLSGLIDAYGQSADLKGDWKVTSDADLASRGLQEDNDLATMSDAPTAVGTQQFGTTKATGKWRFERAVNGNWFAVSPTGGRQWIVGANNVMIDGQMVLDGKEDMYASLPPREGPYGQFYRTAPYFATGVWQRTFDMVRANLYKKYGQNYEATWRTKTSLRLKKWGINAMAGTLDGGMVQGGTPYVKHYQMSYFPTKLEVPRPYWNSPNDPFAPTFLPWCLTQFRPWLSYEAVYKPTNLIGIAIGNEETWGFVTEDRLKYQIPIAALNAAPTQPCKAPLLRILKAKYGTIAKLNAAWGTNFAAWATLEGANGLGTSSPTINAAMRADLSAMLTAYADKLYSTIRASLLQCGYKGQFLGSRDAFDQTPDEVLAVQSKYVDAFTINSYETDNATWNRLSRLTKPILLTEFSVSAVDRGHNSPNKNFEVGTQAERAVKLRAYLDRAATLKNVAGVFFYGLAECPFSGRWSDDERINVGLVDITDQPYREMVNAFRAFGASLPTQRRVR